VALHIETKLETAAQESLPARDTAEDSERAPIRRQAPTRTGPKGSIAAAPGR
jgi:hypothetical protein